MGTEIVGGIWSGSLAILTDAAHMLSDIAGFLISMISICIAKKTPTMKNSYGYHRSEVLGAMTSIFIIWGMVIGLDYEATMRIIDLDKIEINAPIMLITAFVSLACNIFNLIALGHFPMPCINNDDIMGKF